MLSPTACSFALNSNTIKSISSWRVSSNMRCLNPDENVWSILYHVLRIVVEVYSNDKVKVFIILYQGVWTCKFSYTSCIIIYSFGEVCKDFGEMRYFYYWHMEDWSRFEFINLKSSNGFCSILKNIRILSNSHIQCATGNVFCCIWPYVTPGNDHYTLNEATNMLENAAGNLFRIQLAYYTPFSRLPFK